MSISLGLVSAYFSIHKLLVSPGEKYLTSFCVRGVGGGGRGGIAECVRSSLAQFDQHPAGFVADVDVDVVDVVVGCFLRPPSINVFFDKACW